MSSTTATAAAPVPMRAVPRKTPAKRKADEAVAAAGPTVAPAPKAKGSRKSNAAVEPTAPAASLAVVAAKVKAPRAKRVKTEAATAEAGVPAAVPAADEITPAPRVPKPKAVYIEGYGDEDKPEEEQLFTLEAYDLWKSESIRRTAGQTFAQWKLQKKANLKRRRQEASKKKKRSTKGTNKCATAENQKKRLLEMPSAQFQVLDGKWLSSYGFEGSFPAADLATVSPADLPQGSLAALSVFQAAQAHGFKPLGIVSEKRKKDPVTSEMKFVDNVDGEREYVGVALPYDKQHPVHKLGSIFCVSTKDRVIMDVEPDTEGEADSDE